VLKQEPFQRPFGPNSGPSRRTDDVSRKTTFPPGSFYLIVDEQDDREMNSLSATSQISPSTTVAVIFGLFNPGLKALLVWLFFRGLKAPAPSEVRIYNCSTRKMWV
jgi:hypothetical protein